MRPCFKARVIKRPRRIVLETARTLLPRFGPPAPLTDERVTTATSGTKLPATLNPACGMRLTNDWPKQDGVSTRFPNRPGAARRARVPPYQLHTKALRSRVRRKGHSASGIDMYFHTALRQFYIIAQSGLDEPPMPGQRAVVHVCRENPQQPTIDFWGQSKSSPSFRNDVSCPFS